MSARRASRGSTLIEVLIALLLACVGLLAMARLSAAAISHQKSAQVRLLGQTLAQQYAERARLNIYGFDLGAYNLALGSALPAAATLDPDAADLAAAQAVAQADQREFLQAVANVLPEGRARADSRPSATARDLDIWLLWRDTPVNGANSLGPATTWQCPQGLSETDRRGASCLFFRVGL